MNIEAAQKELESFFHKYPVVVYKPNTLIIGPNHPNSSLFYIQSGITQLSAINNEGESFTIDLIKEGIIFPIYQVLSDVKPHYYYKTINELTTYRVPINDFYQFLNKNPRCLFYLNKVLINRVYAVSQRIELFMLSKIEDRLRFLLVYLAKIIGEEKNGKVKIMVPLNHAELASWIHSTRESVSRSFNELKKQQLVDTDGEYIVINDRELLEEKFL